ncbi:MAG TPA: metal ABC transporter permease [Alphaproteobacteria bacterium]|nr:metal ABC transporter permease [Alphaproteobacteria bacterium]
MSIDLLLPFAKYAFMKKALAACAILAIGGTPLGLFLSLRRMALVGDAMSHALLPGVAVAFLIYGASSVWPLTIGGVIAGLFVALLAVFLTRTTRLKEDSSFTLIYLCSIAAGAVIISIKGGSEELVHMLFGDVLAISSGALWLISAVACITLLTLAIFYRSFVLECFDPDFLRAAHRSHFISQLFFALLVINLVAAFQALGTLMALGLMLLPAIAAGFWTRRLPATLALSVIFALLASFTGLLVSYYANLPAGPAVVLAAGALTFISTLAGSHGSLRGYFSGRA